MKLSARNLLKGTVASIKKGAVNTEVVLSLQGGLSIVSVITNASVEYLGLKEGAPAVAIVKASSILVGTDLATAKVSARNIWHGKVAKVVEGPVSAEVDLDIGGGNIVVAVITDESAKTLGLKAGSSAFALIKASSVIIGVE